MSAIVRQNAIDRSVYGGCLVLLGLILLFGANVSTAMNRIFQIGMVLMAGVLIFRRTGPVSATVEWLPVPGSRLWGLFILSVFLQALPIPQTILRGLSPNALQDWVQVVEIVMTARSADTFPYIPPSWFSAAYAPHLAVVVGTDLFACTILFYLLLHLLNSKKQIDFLVWLIVLCSVGKACGMLFQNPIQTDIGTNGLLEIGLTLTLGLYLIHRNPPAPSADGGLGRLQLFYQKTMHRLSADGFNVKALLPVIAGMILILTLFMTGSTESLERVGAALLLSWACVRFRHWPHIGLGVAMILLLVVIALVASGYGSAGIASMMIDYPVWGVGGGNAVNLIPRYAESMSRNGNPELWGRLIRIGVETGVIGILLLSAAGTAFIHYWISIWTRRHDLHARGIGFAVMAACVVMLFGNSSGKSPDGLMASTAFTATLAAGYAAVHRKGRGLMEFFAYPAQPVQWSRPVRLGLAAGSILICLAALTVPLFGRTWVPEPDLTASMDPQEIESRLLKNPASGQSWYELAGLYSQMDTDPLRYVTHWLPLADRCYGQAVKNRPTDADMLFQAARYWVKRSVILPDAPDSGTSMSDHSTPTRQQGIQRFQDLFRQVIILDPDKLKPAAEAVWSYYPQDAIVLGIVPVQDALKRTQLLRFLSLQDGL